jgi:DNA primase
LNIDEAGFTNLVNKFIRNRLSLQEGKLPFEEAKAHEENAKRGQESDFSDHTFNLLFKDDLQEREIARILLEHGNKKWDETQFIADYVLSELPEEDLIDNKTVVKLIDVYRQNLLAHNPLDKSFFIYHTDPELSTLAVSLMEYPYEESEHWKRELSQSAGFQKSLFEQDYKTFLRLANKENEADLLKFLNIGKDNTSQEVESAINYLKLRKIRRLLLQNQADLQKADPSQQNTLFLTHQHLKQMEMELSKKIGSVVIR